MILPQKSMKKTIFQIRSTNRSEDTVLDMVAAAAAATAEDPLEMIEVAAAAALEAEVQEEDIRTESVLNHFFYSIFFYI